MKITIDQEKCIGCGSCSAICPDVFDLSEDNKAILKKDGSNQGQANEDCVKEAAEVCPVQAIETEE